MQVWKILFIGVFACVCLGLAVATVVFTAAQDWAWMAGLLAATVGAGALFALFLRYAGGSLDTPPRGARH